VPYRQALRVDLLESAMDLVEDLVAHPKRVWVACSANVMHEFASNRDSIALELQKYIAELQNSFSKSAQIARLILPDRRIASFEWLEADFKDRILGVLERLTASIAVFRGSPDCMVRARNRVWERRAPSGNSRQQFKDCEIFEEFLDLVAQLRALRFDQAAVFVTPNSDDYGPPPKGYDPIASDLVSVKGQYAGNISWARSIATQK